MAEERVDMVRVDFPGKAEAVVGEVGKAEVRGGTLAGAIVVVEARKDPT